MNNVEPVVDSAAPAATTAGDRARAARDLRWNSGCFIADSVMFGSAMSFLNQTTVLPTFVGNLTDSAFLIGLVATIQSGAWLLPQLFAASLVAGRPRKKPYLVAAICLGRPTYLFFAAFLVLAGAGNQTLALAAFYVALTFFGVMDGLATPPWLDILGRAIPASRRGRVLGIGQMITGVVGVAIGGIVGLILVDPVLPFPLNYALIFAIAGGIWVAAIPADAWLREPPPSSELGSEAGRPGLQAFLAVVGPALREDRRFVGVVVTRLLFGAGVLVYPFYVVFANKVLGFGAEQIGLFLSAQVVGGILGGMIYGQLADRHGTRTTIRAAVPIAALAPALALGASFLGGLPEAPRLAVTAGVFVAVGLTFSSYVLGFMNYVLEIAPEHDRSAYGGLFNTINGMLLVVPALAGWFLEATSYQLLFTVALAMLALAFFASLALGEAGHGRAGAGR